MPEGIAGVGLRPLLQHHAGPVREDERAAQNPDKVAALQRRANDLAAAVAKPMILQTEIRATMERIKMPSSLPADLGSLNEER